MAKNSSKVVHVCTNCGFEYSKWQGRCYECGAWNTIEEKVVVPEKTANPLQRPKIELSESLSVAVSSLSSSRKKEERYKTGISEFDRAVGGGIVKSSVILLSGEPGIGKSTILLQICKNMSKNKILYVSGEESATQIKIRAERLGVNGENVFLLCETNVDLILAEAELIKPDLMIIDSIQTVFSPEVSSISGSITQVKTSAMSIIGATKKADMATVIVGHVNKDGAIAGPKVLEHMVDVVLSFEGERTQSYRLIRAAKNRYGSTNEIGVFEMGDKGLEEVTDPSRAMLSEKPKNVSGSCTVCILEGSRSILAEVQALVSKTVFPSPKRMSTGVEYNRLSILIAVIEKRLGIYFSTQDVYINVTGGLRLDEPSSDLGIVMALISAYRDIEIPDDMVAIGEVGLSGEVRSVSFIESRVKEAARLGFKKIIIPYRLAKKLENIDLSDAEIIPVKSVYDLGKMFPSKN
jgi:DNA repair protein RadA/Sms